MPLNFTVTPKIVESFLRGLVLYIAHLSFSFLISRSIVKNMTLRVVLWVYSEGSESYDRQLFSESKMFSQVDFGFILKKTNKMGV